MGSPPISLPRAASVAALTAMAGCTNPSAAPADGLDCVVDESAPTTECAGVPERRTVRRQVLSDAGALVLSSVSATRSGATLALDIELSGSFDSETDQNIYVFVGQAGAGATYALTADDQYAADLSYPVRTSLALPHTDDIRVGVMAPGPRAYSPQVYVRDPFRAEATGAGAGVLVRSAGHAVHLELQLERYYRVRGAPVPERVSVTVATGRDYVGFIDHLSVPDLGPGASASSSERASPPVLYPTLDQSSHVPRRISVSRAGGTVTVDVETMVAIHDWAQTNIHFFFVPVPPSRPRSRLLDPSGSVALPFEWSYYCAVYSPHRVFCKASDGKDYTFDSSYSERPTLGAAPGVSFVEAGGARYLLSLPAGIESTLTGGQLRFALLVAVGRDGASPTSWYGSPWSRRP